MGKKSVMSAAALFVMLLIMSWLVVSCSSSKEKSLISHSSSGDWTALVSKTIPQPQRAAVVNELGLQLIALVDSMSNDVEALNANNIVLNVNYKITKQEVINLYSGFEKIRGAAFVKYRDIVFAMRKEVTSDEWKILTDN